MLMMRALFLEGCPADAHDARLFPSIDAKHGGMMPADSCDWPQAAPG